MTGDFKTRSVGDVPAPKRELLHEALGISPEHARAAAAAHGGGEPAPGADELCPYCGAHWPAPRDAERAAVVKYLRREAATIRLRDGVAAHLLVMASAIESGDHVK